MKFVETVSALFEHSEELRVVRGELVSLAEETEDVSDRLRISCGVKEIDIVRAMLLCQYELLDTAQIIHPEHQAAYYARRLEILEMTAAQLRRHLDEITALSTSAERASVTHWMVAARDLIAVALGVMDRLASLLKGEAMAERKDQTLH